MILYGLVCGLGVSVRFRVVLHVVWDGLGVSMDPDRIPTDIDLSYCFGQYWYSPIYIFSDVYHVIEITSYQNI